MKEQIKDNAFSIALEFLYGIVNVSSYYTVQAFVLKKMKCIVEDVRV